jgi:hypothetical protein
MVRASHPASQLNSFTGHYCTILDPGAATQCPRRRWIDERARREKCRPFSTPRSGAITALTSCARFLYVHSAVRHLDAHMLLFEFVQFPLLLGLHSSALGLGHNSNRPRPRHVQRLSTEAPAAPPPHSSSPGATIFDPGAARALSHSPASGVTILDSGTTNRRSSTQAHASTARHLVYHSMAFSSVSLSPSQLRLPSPRTGNVQRKVRRRGPARAPSNRGVTRCWTE